VIHIDFGNCQWGTNPIDKGVTINLQDRDSKIIVTVPFTDQGLEQLVTEIAQKGLTDEQKRKLAPLFNGGIILPGTDDFTPGPQG
jgi:hypothetical protein